ncbi:hypothetical protein UK23_31665 [Lentzea aerocolonigenes]|uniref:Uncharacterized protein n=1 Tax=Lentzea aerocolonigenes TaxID=68170 RepID=A0A0F0GJY7_LENAE|nr:hypothetical protein [Lentzea aerocolonigenes]KJK43849.1 hypothetical protein UK23_31665 [Lentzea aerocolonigenes]
MTNEPITKDGRRRILEALMYLHDATSAEGPASREEAEILSGVMTMLAFSGIDVARRVRAGADLDPAAARVLDEFEEHITRAASLSQQFLGLVQHADPS